MTAAILSSPGDNKWHGPASPNKRASKQTEEVLQGMPVTGWLALKKHILHSLGQPSIYHESWVLRWQ